MNIELITDLDKLVGLNFKRLRKSRRVSQVKLAANIGMHQAAISRIEKGTQSLSLIQAKEFLLFITKVNAVTIRMALPISLDEFFLQPKNNPDLFKIILPKEKLKEIDRLTKKIKKSMKEMGKPRFKIKNE